MRKIMLSFALITGFGLTHINAQDANKVSFSIKSEEGDMNNLKKNNKKTEIKVVGAYNKIEKSVVSAYQKIEDGVVGTYDKIEKSVVTAYQKIEDKFVPEK